MNHPLLQKVDEVRRQARRVVWLHAWGWTAATILLTAISLALIDYFLRPQELGLRWMLTIAAIAAAVWSARRWLMPAWEFRPSTVEIAQRIERCFPEFRTRLSSSVEFLGQSDDVALGSVALRRRVIAETEARLVDLPLGRVVNARPQTQALGVMAAVMSIIAFIAVLNLPLVATAVGRLSAPWSTLNWPRWNHLAFVAPPEKLARGTSLEMTVVDESGHLTEMVTLAIKYDDGEQARLEMKPLDGRMVHRLENVTRSFTYRASGGDDDTMPWQTLEVVEPIRVVETEMIATPPEYAGRPYPLVGNVISVLAGTRLALQGSVDRPLQSARIVREGAKQAIDLEVLEAGLKFGGNAKWLPEQNGEYRLELVGDDGVSIADAMRWDIRVVEDALPTLSVDSPSDGAFATPNALLPISGLAKDDLALAKIELRYARPSASDQEWEAVELWSTSRNPLRAVDSRGITSGSDSRTFRGEWDLQSVFGLEAGQVLSWHARAADFKPQWGQTSANRLTLISPEEMQERLVQRQDSALAQLAEALQAQRETRQQVATLEVQWREVQAWRPQDRDQLQGAELRQRQVQNLVGKSPTGAATILSAILVDIRNNRLELPEMSRRCEEILAAIERLEQGEFLTPATSFATVLREARSPQPDAANTTSQLATLGKTQDAAIAALEAMLQNLTQLGSFERLRREVIDLREEQRKLLGQSHKLQAELVAAAETTPQHRADAKQLGLSQAELARRFEKLQGRLAEFAIGEHGDKRAAATAQAAVDVANQLAVSGKMREATLSAEGLKLGETITRQQEADLGLTAMLDALSGKQEASETKSIDELRSLSNRLDELTRQQEQIQKELEEQAKSPNAAKAGQAAEKQRGVENATRKAADQMKLNSPAAAKAAEQAADAMKKAAASAASKPADAAKEASEAKDQLAATKQELEKKIEEKEIELLREQLAKLEQLVQGLLHRQEAAIKETARLREVLKKQNGELTASQKQSLATLAAEQEALAAETIAMSQAPKLPAAFALQLGWASNDMSQATDLVRAEQLEPAEVSQRSAADRLAMLAKALEVDPPPPPPSPSESPMTDPPPMPPPGNRPPPNLRDVSEVKLLRAMQGEINRKTREIERLRDPQGSLPPTAAEQLQSLAEEQGRVAELAMKLVRSLSQPKPATPEEGEVPKDSSDEDLLKQLDDTLLPGTEK